VEKQFGRRWQQNYHVDWAKLPQLIVTNLDKQLRNTHPMGYNRGVEVTRTCVFTSMRSDTEVG
jgi:hypothetical protein